MTTLGFLHTSPVHVSTFDQLVAEISPGTSVLTVVDESLLERARAMGADDAGLRSATAEKLLAIAGVDVIICTCSTIGGVAEVVGAELGLRVVRVDRPMAELAVVSGHRISVVAALPSTLAPTRELLESVARENRRTPVIDVHLVDGAWQRFETGDEAGYVAMIAEALPALAVDADVIVLAQASMAAVVDHVEVGCPVLASPRIAVAALAG